MILPKILTPSLGVLLTIGTAAIAQQSQSPAAPEIERTHRSQRQRGMRPGKGLAIDPALNLTDEQRQQQRAIRQRHLAASKTQREQLFQLREKRMEGNFTAEDQSKARALRQEIRSSRAAIHGETMNILTPEQRLRVETLQQQRREKGDERMRRRRGLRDRP